VLGAPQKKSQENINSRLALVMKSGKFTLGTKTSIKCLRSGKGEQHACACLSCLWHLCRSTCSSSCMLTPACSRAFQDSNGRDAACTCVLACCVLLGISAAVLMRLLPLPAAKLIIICNNCPPIRKSEIEYYAMLSKTGVHHYTGSECRPAVPGRCASLAR